MPRPSADRNCVCVGSLVVLSLYITFLFSVKQERLKKKPVKKVKQKTASKAFLGTLFAP